MLIANNLFNFFCKKKITLEMNLKSSFAALPCVILSCHFSGFTIGDECEQGAVLSFLHALNT